MSEWTANHYIKALWRWAWVIVAIVLVSMATSVVVSLVMKPVYRASATIMAGEDNTNPQVKMEDYVLSQRLATGYAGLAKRQVILEDVVRTLGLNTDWRSIQENVLVAPVQNTSLLEIRVSDSNPRRAAAIANEIARQLILHSSTLANEQDLQQRQSFAKTQLDALQSNIDSAQATIQQKQAALDTETSARAVSDLKDEIKALQIKVTDWRTEYQKLLSSASTKSPSTITVVETAAPPTKPVSPNILFNVLLAALAGLVLSCGCVMLIEYLRAGKVTTLDELSTAAQSLGLAVISNINRKKRSGPDAVLITRDPHSPIAEQFRVLRSNIRFTWGAPEPIALVITSAGVAEGKSTISANLAASFAQAGKQTILVDADLRHSSLHSILGLSEPTTGLTSLLTSEGTLPTASLDVADGIRQFREQVDEALIETSIPNLTLLAAGPAAGINPGELLASPRMVKLVDLLQESADVVIIDTPPLLAVTDTALLASLSVGVVLIAQSNRTPLNDLGLAREVLERAQARLLGTVLNRASTAPSPYYAYGAQGHDDTTPRRAAFRSIRGAR